MVAVLVAAGGAMAQPSAIDLGTLVDSVPATASFNISPGMIQWYTFTTPGAALTPSSWLDIVTNGPVTIDTMIGLYDASGNRISSDDDDGPPAGVGFSSLSYGSTNPSAPGRFAAPAGSVAFNGRDGANLPAGQYYLAVTGFSATFNATGWSITTSHTRSGQVDVWVNYGTDSSPYPPSGVGSASPNPVLAGNDTLLRVTASPGGNPASSSMSVSIDLSSLGMGSSETMYDDGTNGDVTIGDNVFSRLVTVPSMGDASLSMAFVVSDDLSRSSGGNLALTVQAPPSWDEFANGGSDAGDMPATAQVTSGSGPMYSIAGTFDANDTDLFLIEVCDQGSFTATTFNTYTTVDTQLWLFNLDGTGVTFNDDVPDGYPGDATLQSRISGIYVPGNGQYYLAVNRYNRNALDETASLMWIDTPFNVERFPDGPGAAGTLSSWTGTTTGGVGYRVIMTGACFPTIGPACDPDVNCDGSANGVDVEIQELAVGGDFTDYCQVGIPNIDDGDFNRDGAVNGTDVEAVENAVGGICP
ncbi:MAG: hypothetical protein HBSAPP03_08210 [Phycisphaerae bacterium]|nr:MAG: hypothetical protein HBSAPP03_08210 [Phycisphaerae bacterium]